MSVDSAFTKSENWGCFMEQWSNSSQSSLCSLPKKTNMQGRIVPARNVQNKVSIPGPPQNIDMSKLGQMCPLPLGTSVQVTFNPATNRYDQLKYAAEQILKDQLSTKTERDISAAKLEALEATCQSQAIKIQKLRSEKSQLQSLFNMEKGTISKLEFENKTLQTMLSSLNSQVLNFFEQVENAKKDKESLEETLNEQGCRIEKVEETIKNASAERDKVKAEHENLKMHCSELEDQYKELKYLFDKLTQERDDFQKQLGETQEILEKKIRAEEQMNSEVEELVEKNSVLQENINELEKELEESRRSLSLCESSERHFKEVWEHEVVCRSQLEKELQEVRIEMEEKLGSIADEMQDMSQKAEELKQLCSSLDDQLVEKDREISQFENTIREGIIQYSRLEEDKRSIEGTLRYVQIELDDLRLEKENLEMERDTLRQEKYRFEEGMKILEYEKERWEVEKLDMQYERNKLEQNNIMLEDSNVKLVQEKEILEHNNRELTQEKEGLNIEKDQVIQEKNKLSMEKENLEREMDAIIREKHSIEEERDQLKKQIDVLNVELESLRGLYEMSNKDLRALEEEWKNFKRQEELTRESLEANNRLGIVELKKKMVDLIQEKDYLIREKELELSYLEREKEGLVVELKEKNEELKRIQDLLEELKIKSVIEKEQNQKENMEQQNRIQELEIQVGEIVKGYDNMKCEFRRCTEELENLLNVNTELESENVNLKNQKKDLENELNDKRMEYADTQLRQMKLEMDSEYELEVRKNMERAKKQETNMKISEVKRKSKGHNKTVDKEHHLGYSKRKPSQASLTPKTTLSAKKVNPLDFIISESLSDKMPSSTKQESQSKAFSSRSVQSHKKDSRPLKFGVKLPKNPDREKKALETSDGIFNNDDDPFAFID